MSETPGHDEVTPSESSNQPTVESYCVSPDIQNLLKVFVIQSKEDETEKSEEKEESITLYADKMESQLVNELLSQRPAGLAPAPDHVVQMILPLNFGTETPGDDLLATIFKESVEDSLPSLSQTVSGPVSGPVGETGHKLTGHPSWVSEKYPEIFSQWKAVSCQPVFQGAVRMFCSRCRENPSQGFLDGLPVCEACRVGQPCSVCRIRVTSTFSYGLAICEADRLFLYRTFSQQPLMSVCQGRVHLILLRNII